MPHQCLSRLLRFLHSPILIRPRILRASSDVWGAVTVLPVPSSGLLSGFPFVLRLLLHIVTLLSLLASSWPGLWIVSWQTSVHRSSLLFWKLLP